MSAVAVPADRRFRRAHVKPGRRRGALRTVVPALKYGLAIVAIAAGLYYGSGAVAGAQLLQVSRIVVRGNEHLESGDVRGVLSGLRGESLILTDLEAWRRRLLASPWVVEASLRRRLPSTVEVDLVERRPVAAGRLNGDLYLIDGQGVVIDVFGPQHAGMDLPIVDGLTAARPGHTPSASGIDSARAALAARLLEAVAADQEISRRISQIGVSDLHNASVILTGDAAVLYVGEERFLERLRSYAALASALRERFGDIDYADLRFEDRVYVKPRSSQRPRVGDR